MKKSSTTTIMAACIGILIATLASCSSNDTPVTTPTKCQVLANGAMEVHNVSPLMEDHDTIIVGEPPKAYKVRVLKPKLSPRVLGISIYTVKEFMASASKFELPRDITSLSPGDILLVDTHGTVTFFSPGDVLPGDRWIYLIE